MLKRVFLLLAAVGLAGCQEQATELELPPVSDVTELILHSSSRGDPIMDHDRWLNGRFCYSFGRPDYYLVHVIDQGVARVAGPFSEPKWYRLVCPLDPEGVELSRQLLSSPREPS